VVEAAYRYDAVIGCVVKTRIHDGSADRPALGPAVFKGRNPLDGQVEPGYPCPFGQEIGRGFTAATHGFQGFHADKVDPLEQGGIDDFGAIQLATPVSVVLFIPNSDVVEVCRLFLF
jgi:hypothetical protein